MNQILWLIFFIFTFVLYIFNYSNVFDIYFFFVIWFWWFSYFIYIINVMYFAYFFVFCFVFKLFLLCVHLTKCAITLEILHVNHKNMVNCVIVFDVKIIYMIISSYHASFMNFGKKIGWPYLRRKTGFDRIRTKIFFNWSL